MSGSVSPASNGRKNARATDEGKWNHIMVFCSSICSLIRSSLLPNNSVFSVVFLPSQVIITLCKVETEETFQEGHKSRVKNWWVHVVGEHDYSNSIIEWWEFSQMRYTAIQ